MTCKQLKSGKILSECQLEMINEKREYTTVSSTRNSWVLSSQNYHFSLICWEMWAEFLDITVFSNIFIHWVFLMSVAIKEVPYCMVTFCSCGPHTWTPSQNRPGKNDSEKLEQRELLNTDVYSKLTLLCSFVYEIYFLSFMVLSLCNLNRFFHGCMWSLNAAFFLLMWTGKKKIY